jgi:hypothetical protein
MGCCGSCGGQDSNQTRPQDKEQNKGQEQKPVAEQNKDKETAQK